MRNNPTSLREQATACSPMREHGVQAEIKVPSLRKLATEEPIICNRDTQTVNHFVMACEFPLPPAYAGFKLSNHREPQADACGYMLPPVAQAR